MTGSAAGVQDVIDRLRDIDGSLPADDGAAVFNRMYLEVTERVAEGLRGSHTFHDDAFMAHLDVAFASLWLTAYDAAEAGQDVPKAWAPLFERRATPGLLPVQFALAGMNAHIEHDLPLAVIATCRARRTSPDRPGVHADYEAVNGLLAAAEAKIRRSFLSEAGRLVDRRVGHVVHLVSSWDIDKARDLAWVNVEALWTMRPVPRLYRRYSDALARTVGMTSRCLLTPCL